VPPGAPPHPEASFVLLWVVAADVLAEIPGDEIVICHKLGSFSQCAIRVFDFDGVERYLVWHDGTVFRPHWLEEARLLVCSSWRADHRWTERGVDLPKNDYPLVFFGLRPIDGHVAGDRFLAMDVAASDPTLAWYRWLGPTGILGSMRRMVAYGRGAGGQWSDGHHAEIQVSGWADERPHNEQPTIALVVSESGEIVHRWCGDAYKRELLNGAVPDLAEFRLFDLSELPPPLDTGDDARDGHR
jgi:hypothetical protein